MKSSGFRGERRIHIPSGSKRDVFRQFVWQPLLFAGLAEDDVLFRPWASPPWGINKGFSALPNCTRQDSDLTAEFWNDGELDWGIHHNIAEKIQVSEFVSTTTIYPCIQIN